MNGTGSGNRISGWGALIIADVCAPYWLVRAGVIGTELAVILAAAAAAVILAARGIAGNRARRRRRELNQRLAADMRRVAGR